jgi:3-oxoacyl-[acyl-carrier-protein] synthase-3
MLQTKRFTKALVIGVERLSEFINIEDRSTNILFGDGAGAVIIENTDSKGIVAEFAKCKYAPAEVLSIGHSADDKKTP